MTSNNNAANGRGGPTMENLELANPAKHHSLRHTSTNKEIQSSKSSSLLQGGRNSGGLKMSLKSLLING
jgi:hypothetical protein